MDMSAEKREVVEEEKPVFGLEDKPPFIETMLLGLQHMLAIKEY